MTGGNFHYSDEIPKVIDENGSLVGLAGERSGNILGEIMSASPQKADRFQDSAEVRS